MAVDRAALPRVARVASQYMSAPRRGMEIVVRWVVRFLQSYSRMPNSTHDEDPAVEVMTDSGWAGDMATRQSCSGGLILIGGSFIVGQWRGGYDRVR